MNNQQHRSVLQNRPQRKDASRTCRMRLFKTYLVLLAILELGLGLLAYNYRAATSASIMTICASVALTMIFGALIFTATLWVCMVLDPDLR